MEIQTCSSISIVSAQTSLKNCKFSFIHAFSLKCVSTTSHPSLLPSAQADPVIKSVSYKKTFFFRAPFFLLPWLNQKNTIIFCRYFFLLGSARTRRKRGKNTRPGIHEYSDILRFLMWRHENIKSNIYAIKPVLQTPGFIILLQLFYAQPFSTS